MRNYYWHGKQYQFDEKSAPKDAIPVDQITRTAGGKALEAVKKALTPRNKGRQARTK